MLQGAAERAVLVEKLAWDRAAWSTAHMLNSWSRHRVTAERLLGRPMVGKEQSAEEARTGDEAVDRVLALIRGSIEGQGQGRGLGPIVEQSKEERAAKFAQVWSHFEALRDSGRLRPLGN